VTIYFISYVRAKHWAKIHRTFWKSPFRSSY